MTTILAKAALDVGLVTANPDPLLDFYVGVFGLERLEPLIIPSVGTIHKLAAGDSVLRIMQPEQPPQKDESEWSASSGIRYMTIEVLDATQVANAVPEYGGEVKLGPIELRPGRFVCQVHDPDGNMIEVGQG